MIVIHCYRVFLKYKIMTTKEKAEEILHKMWDNGLSRGQAEKCALVAVEEILNTIYNEDFDGHLIDENGANKFWEDVRDELNTL